MATKTSILIFYLRLARNTQPFLRFASWVTLGMVNVAGLVVTFIDIFQCTPIGAAWAAESQGKCLSIVTLFLCSAPVNIISDLVILLLPVPVFTGLRLPQRQKTILVITFGLGIFVTVVDIVRIYYLQQASTVHSSTQERIGTRLDFGWNASPALMWSTVEVNLGIICACIPSLKPLAKRLIPSMVKDLSRNSTKDEYYDSNLAPDSSVATNGRREHEPRIVQDSTIRPLPHSQSGGDEENEMKIINFLTTPEISHSLAQTAARRPEHRKNSIYFGFIDVKEPKSMLETRGTEAFKYCATVTILFFLWGFSYGLLTCLNGAISQIDMQRTSKSVGLTVTYFGAYFFGALTVGQYVLRHAGFKITFITGLCIYGTGSLMFWPSAVLYSFPGFVISTFVVGFGLSILETAANPFIALCGPSEYAEYRLVLAQAVQGVGSILSQILAQRVLFKSVVRDQGLVNVQWTYLAITLFTVILAMLFYYMPLPEVSDTDLQLLADDLEIYESTAIIHPRLPLIYATLFLGIVAQFTHVAAQQGLSIFFADLLRSFAIPETSTPLPLAIGSYEILSSTFFAIGRFAVVPLCLVIRPRILLLINFILLIITSALVSYLQFSANSAQIASISTMTLLLVFFEGPIFPLVFALSIRGLGRRTKIGAACMTASCSGGAVFPFVMLAVQSLNGMSIQHSFVVVFLLFICGLVFCGYLNGVESARKQVDAVPAASLGRDGR
jgi:fucose permease